MKANSNEIGETTRQQKVNRLLQKELAEILQQQTKAYGNGLLISVSIVRITADMSIAKVYLSVFPSERAQEICGNINRSATQLRYELGTRLRHSLRIVPELRFYIDDTLDYLEHIDGLLT